MIKNSGRPPISEGVKCLYPIRSYVKKTTYDKIQAIANKRKLRVAAIVRRMLEESLEEVKITAVIREMIEESLNKREVYKQIGCTKW